MIARLLAWIRQETALMTADNWEGIDMRVAPPYQPCSSEDPRCAETLRRLAECRERMRRMKAGILDGDAKTRPYTRGADVAATIRKAQGFGNVRRFK